MEGKGSELEFSLREDCSQSWHHCNPWAFLVKRLKLKESPSAVDGLSWPCMGWQPPIVHDFQAFWIAFCFMFCQFTLKMVTSWHHIKNVYSLKPVWQGSGSSLSPASILSRALGGALSHSSMAFQPSAWPLGWTVIFRQTPTESVWLTPWVLIVTCVRMYQQVSVPTYIVLTALSKWRLNGTHPSFPNPKMALPQSAPSVRTGLDSACCWTCRSFIYHAHLNQLKFSLPFCRWFIECF